MHAVLGIEPVEFGGQARPVPFQPGGDRGQEQPGGQPVLVAHRLGADAESDRLLVAVGEAGNPRDPFEARQRLPMVQPVAGGDPAEQARGDDRVGQRRDARRSGGPLRRLQPSGDGLAEHGADLVPRELPPCAAAGGHRGRAPVGVGIRGDDEVGARAPGRRHGQVEGPCLLRVREGDRRKAGIGFALLGHLDDAGESRIPEDPPHDLGADPVHRRVDDGQIPRAGRHRGHAVADVGVDEILADRLVSVGQCDAAGGRRRGDRFGYPCVGGGNELDAPPPLVRAATAQVDLVSVVAGGVVGGGDHHARVGVQAADRVGEQGSGQRARHDPGPHARGGHDRGRVLGELPGVVARIVSDGHEGVGPCGLRQVGDESRGRLAHHRPVHAERPGGHRAAQPGRAELEEAGEAVVQRGGGRRVARLRGVQEPFEFGAAFFVRIVGDPFAHAVGAIHRRSLRRRRAVRAGGEPSRRRGCARRRTPRVGPGLPRRMSA